MHFADFFSNGLYASHGPYGEKSIENVSFLSEQIVLYVFNEGCDPVAQEVLGPSSMGKKAWSIWGGMC